MSLVTVLHNLEEGQNLSADDARLAFDAIFSGRLSQEQIASFLLALCAKGETVDELLGAVQSMRSRALTINAPPGTIDIVGTGGDQNHTLNISTAAALVVAACGVPVAKHGNRASSSRSGSSDVLAALGINLEPELGVLERCLNEANLCFLFAPRHHPAMKNVVEVRKKIGVRTIFNLLGPLTNPANVRRHLIGVYELEWLGPMAEVLKQLGSEKAWLSHGYDDMDEITTTGPTDIVELNNGMMHHFTVTPEEFGLPRVHISELHGEDAPHNAIEIRRLLRGLRSPYRDVVLMNAAAALVVADKVTDMPKGLRLAAQVLDSGAAYNTLDKIVKFTTSSFA
jgi:anthranilate phosphoribosyltransferase